MGEAAPLPFTAKADLVRVHRGVARTEFTLRKGNDLEEPSNLFPVELFEFYPVCAARRDERPFQVSGKAFFLLGCGSNPVSARTILYNANTTGYVRALCCPN